MKIVNGLLLLLAVGLLGLIAYNTSLGKILPAPELSKISCKSMLTRELFFSSLLRQMGLNDLASDVKHAYSIDNINKLVVKGSNIDAPRTLWFQSVSEPGECQAQIFLQTPNKDSNNTAYIGFSIDGFSQIGMPESVLESIHLKLLGTQWFKE